jgi:hypothetical protein
MWRFTQQNILILLFSRIENEKGLGAIRAKIGPTSDVDKIFSKMYSQYVLFRNKYSYLICVSNSEPH